MLTLGPIHSNLGFFRFARARSRNNPVNDSSHGGTRLFSSSGCILDSSSIILADFAMRSFPISFLTLEKKSQEQYCGWSFLCRMHT